MPEDRAISLESSQSDLLTSRALRVLVPGSQDYLRFGPSKGFPMFFKHAKGPFVWGADDKRYLDFFLGSGSVILGHGDQQQVQYVRSHTDHGATVSLRHPEELNLAEKLRETLSCLERFMFFKTGSECAHQSVQIALRQTGRSAIVSLGYHGWLTPFGQGKIATPGLRILEPAWDLDAVLAAIAEAGTDLAAVIISPSVYATDPDFYRQIVARARKAGGLLIMDEIKTGFRWLYPCLSVAWDLKPDILLLAKAVSNGFPMAVLAGRDPLLGQQDLVSTFSTFACENVSLFASVACLTALDQGAYERFRRASSFFYHALSDELSKTPVQVLGTPTFFRLALPEGMDQVGVAADLAERGILFHPKDEVLLSAAHDKPDILKEASRQFAQVLIQRTLP